MELKNAPASFVDRAFNVWNRNGWQVVLSPRPKGRIPLRFRVCLQI